MNNINNDEFDLKKTLKTGPDNSFYNVQSILHLSANQITKLLFYTGVAPHQVILFSLLVGVGSAFLITSQSLSLRILGGAFLFYKNVLDKVDGSLARAKGLDSRRGRFYDSLSDFFVNLAVFSSIAYYLSLKYNNYWIYPVVYLAMIISMIQCSYFIYYQVSFIKQTGKQTVNRLIEKVTEQDLVNQDRFTIFLQKIFQIIYGWQDYLVFRLDRLLRDNLTKLYPENDLNKYWFNDKKFLTIASILSIGTHMVLIAVFSIINLIEVYLFVNLILLNLLLIYSIIYHYKSVKNELKGSYI